MTLLQVTWHGGKTERCDAKCHDAHSQACRCCCKGRFHGKQEGGLAFNQAVLEHQQPLLAELALLEEAGALWIDAFRARPGDPLERRRRGAVRAHQELLFDPLGYPMNASGRHRRA